MKFTTPRLNIHQNAAELMQHSPLVYPMLYASSFNTLNKSGYTNVAKVESRTISLVLSRCGNVTEQVTQTLNYLPYGEDWVDIQNFAETQYPRLGIYSFNGKEKDYESGYHYYGARYYWSEVLTGWLSVDPMMDKYPSISSYAYCVWNPVKLVDPDGRKDRPFKDGDRRVHDIPGTETPVFYNTIGIMQVFSPYSILNAYNCHSYAWHGSWGDKNPATGDIPYDQYGITSLPRWDQNPADDIRDVLSRGGRQLGSDENNIVGDRVIYFTDQNENGIYDDGEFVSHSAIVTAVDNEGYTIEVTGKRGSSGISTNHPDAPGYYKTANDPNTGKKEKQSRAYFRMPSEN